ncbi:MAG: M20 family metallo-hydrolase [Cyclobacteriaceae bacterium]|nr:M20 family metallo-hydrolase [Cyclobacteriaceae bacterium]
MDKYSGDYIQLLEKLVETPSFSREEDKTAWILNDFFTSRSIETHRIKNNVIARNKHFDPNKPTILLNSHHDTVKPGSSWKKDPFTPVVVDGRFYGLGSNDAGASLVCLIAAFVHYYASQNLKYNLILAATAEEEISGKDGVELVLPELGPIDFAIVGEPTNLKMAVAEKGLMVLDCIAKGRGGHAARDEGDNAIYKAMRDIEWFQNYKFDKTSDKLGDVKMSVTVINAGSQHNVVPDECRFVVDIRSTDVYSNDEILNVIKQNVTSDIVARSTRLQPSGLKNDHLLFDVAKKLKLETFGSPTLSDQALMPFPSVKIGPGDSARSHTADEYIHLKEIEDGIQLYLNLLKTILV